MGDAKKFHLIVPTALLEILQPTGCRQSPEAEAAWLLHASIIATRETLVFGELPIFSDLDDLKGSKPKEQELHVPLSEEDLKFLTELSEQEGGSRGKLARLMLLTCERILHETPRSLTSEGLAKEILIRFSPPSEQSL